MHLQCKVDLSLVNNPLCVFYWILFLFILNDNDATSPTPGIFDFLYVAQVDLNLSKVAYSWSRVKKEGIWSEIYFQRLEQNMDMEETNVFDG